MKKQEARSKNERGGVWKNKKEECGRRRRRRIRRKEKEEFLPTAECNGVSPYLSLALSSKPFFTNNPAVSRSPDSTQIWRRDRPSIFRPWMLKRRKREEKRI